MQFFQEMLTALNQALAALDQPNATDADRDHAEQLAARVFEVSEQMGGSILGDVDDQLMTKAKEIQNRLGK